LSKRGESMLIDAKKGNRTRSISITDSDEVMLSAVQVGTLTQRFRGGARA
jgi:regulator of extracellular matrix RemA (YlzA/DUF370 family)